MSADTVPIPEVSGLPFLGSFLDIDLSFPLGTFLQWAEKHGELYRIRFPGREIIHVTTHALAHELCDETRFHKAVTAALDEVRSGVHDGLFTARMGEPNWGIAHRVLMPAFGPLPIQAMFPEMHEIAAQLALKWARHGPAAPIMVTDDFTRLTLDTLALCSMDFRFNSFYHDELHPFITAMGNFLTACGTRVTRPKVLTSIFRSENNKFWDDIGVLRSTAEHIVKSRKANPTSRKDLLSAMLDGVDPKTSQKLTDESIIDNLITFLIAGHETTSGMLSFAFYQLLKNPETYRKARKEVDDVIGTGPVKVEHMNKLPYIAAVLRETLRLTPTIPIIGIQAKEDTIVGGKYFVQKGQAFGVLLAKVHLDPKVYGETANDFIPERMLDDKFEKLAKDFPDSWKPFGNGARGCIGRPFAWQEALIVMAMILQNFDLSFDDPSYELQYKQTLTTKPKGFYMRASVRDGLSATELGHRLSGTSQPSHINGVAKGASKPGGVKTETKREGKPMSIFYGSNTGTCEALAQRLAADANLHGYEATVVDSMDAAKNKLPTDGPVVIITASYEGQPPDNARVFCEWLKSLTKDELQKISYTVFGCGHHDWAQTFHKVPKLVDDIIAARGGSRICQIGLADAAQGEMFTDFEQWEDDIFWPAVESKYGTFGDGLDGDAQFTPSLSIQFSTPRATTLRQDVKEAVVVASKVLTAPGASQKNHIEIKLPVGMTYRAGDYLAVLPVNPIKNVNRVMRRFSLAWDSNITIDADGRTTLPTNVPVPVYDILASYVELAQPATKRGILVLAEATSDSATKSSLELLAGSSYSIEISRKRVSVLDLLEKFASVQLSFAAFLSLLPPMRVRQYSISSSPLCDPTRATLTFSLLSEPSLANKDTRHVGVASSYLASLATGDKLHVSVRRSHAEFQLPVDATTTPIVMVAAGSGIAPFRGFIQERAAQLAAGRNLAPALLFFGCRAPGTDDLYREEFDRWEKMGAVSVRRTYSRASGQLGAEEAAGCKHVQDRLWHDREELMELWTKGSKTYVCGSRGVGENVKKVVIQVAMEMQRLKVERGESTEEPSEQQALKWFEGIRNERYATDVFD